MMPALSTSPASAPVPALFPQLSPHVPSYRPIIPNPCALGQQVTIVLSHLIVSSRLIVLSRLVLSCLIVLSRLMYFYPDHS